MDWNSPTIIDPKVGVDVWPTNDTTTSFARASIRSLAVAEKDVATFAGEATSAKLLQATQWVETEPTLMTFGHRLILGNRFPPGNFTLRAAKLS